MAVIESAIQRDVVYPLDNAHDVVQPGTNSYRHIVVALDGSELAEKILPVVVPLARAFGSHVTLLRVVAPTQLPIYAGDVGMYSPRIYYGDVIKLEKEARREALDYLSPRCEQLEQEGLAVSCCTPEGSAVESIVEHARAVDADLIAVTTHGRGGLGRLVFGSVAEAVLRSAPCPVLLVRVQDGSEGESRSR